MVVLACVLLHERGATASFRGVWHGQPAMQRWARLSPDCDVVTRSGRHLARSRSLGGHDAMRPSPVHTVHPGVLASWQCRPPPLESPPRVDLPLSLAGVSSPHVSSLTPRHAICLAADALRMRDGQAAQATALRHAPFCRDLRAATTPGAHGDRVLGLRCRRRAATKRHACSLGPATAMKRNRLARAALANETARVMQCAGTRRCHLLNCCLLYIYASSQAHREPHRVVRMLRAIPAHRDAALPLLTECASIRLFPSCVISQAASIRGPVPDQLSSQPLPDLQLTEHAAQTSSSSSARSPFRVSPLTQLGILPKPQAASPARQASELLLQRLEVIP